VTWHVDDRLWEAFESGETEPALSASIEAHLTSCSVCQAAVRGREPQELSAEAWDSLQAVITRPRIALPLRWLRWFGVPERELVLLGAADAVMMPWVTAVGAALVCGLVSGSANVHQHAVFLTIAPLIPLMSVAAAFQMTDDIREVSAATPYSKLRLALLRTTIALVVAMPATLGVGLLVSSIEEFALFSLLPGITLTALALVGLTWFEPAVVGGALSLAWVVAASVINGLGDPSWLTGPVSQAVLVVAAIAATAMFVLRHATWRLWGGAA